MGNVRMILGGEVDAGMFLTQILPLLPFLLNRVLPLQVYSLLS